MGGIWKTVFQTSGARVYSMVVGMLTLALTARYLGPEGRGQVAVLTTWASMFATFLGLSLGQAAIFRMTNAQSRLPYEVIVRALVLLASVLSLVAIISAPLIFLLAPVPASVRVIPIAVFIGVATIPFLMWEQIGSSLLIALDRVSIYNMAQIVGRTLAVVALILFLFAFKWGVAGAMASVLIGQAAVALFGIRTILKDGSLPKVNAAEALAGSKALVKDGLKLHLNAVGNFLFASTGVLILDYYHGAAKAAFFQLATQLIGVLCIIPQAVSVTISAKVTALGPDGAWPAHRKIIQQTLLLMIAIIIVAYFLAPLAILLFGGSEFSPAVSLFRWLLPSVLGVAISLMMAPQWIGRGYFWQAAALTLFCGLVSVAICVPLVSTYGDIGAVVAYLATFFLSVVFNGAMYAHCKRLHKRNEEAITRL